jgi:outer membrane protein, heavy metal efflux system
MLGFWRRAGCGLVLSGFLAANGYAQRPLTWPEVRDKFENGNPTLRAGQIGVDEAKAQEITAYLRPNPQASLGVDQLGSTGKGPFNEAVLNASVNYLHERQHKRELRLEAAQEATKVAVSTQADLERSLLFNLRSAFVGTLQAKAVLRVAKENLDYWDHLLKISNDRLGAGDLAQIDYERLELQRVQFESDWQAAEVNLRTQKIQLLMLLNDRTPVDQFDVAGAFDYSDQLQALEDFRKIALDMRPDLRAAAQSVDEAQANHKLAVANGSTDPTINVDVGFPSVSQDYVNYTPFLREYVGFGFSIPLRIFDRNQGEKLRTQLDVDRNERLLDASRAQVFNDVDSAYAQLNSNLILLRPFKAKYLQEALHVRDTVAYSYQRGGASLLDLLNAESDYRAVQLSYVNLIGAYLTAAAQLNMAVGVEAIP